jgi:hypothetical protein
MSIGGFDYNKAFFEGLLKKYYDRSLDRKEAPELIHYLKIEKNKALAEKNFSNVNNIDRMLFVLDGYINGAYDLSRPTSDNNQKVSNL